MSETDLLESLPLPPHDVLTALVGTQVRADGVLLSLDEVTPAQRLGDLETFSLCLSGGDLRGQGILRVALPGHGPVDLFLVAIAPGRYEATVSRVAP